MIAHHEALSDFPELQRLIDLRAAGWSFAPVHDGDGELRQMNGLRMWPCGQADALRVRYTTDAAAIRCDHTGGVLWSREGTLVEVVDGLLALPDPDHLLAPRLVRATVPAFWNPHHR